MKNRKLVAFIAKWRCTVFCTLLLTLVAIVLTSSQAARTSGARVMSNRTLRQSGTPSRWLSRLIGLSALPRKDPLTGLTPKAYSQLKLREEEHDNNEPLKEGELLDHEAYWALRLTYPTGDFDPQWVREAVDEDRLVARTDPAGARAKGSGHAPQTLNPVTFTPIGPSPERMTGCSGCFDYGTTAGRVNSIAIDPTTTISGSIVAYIAAVDGGIWKTANCCNAATTWTSTTDDPLVSTSSVDSVVIDPNNHNTIYAGTGDLNYGSFSMGSQGILKSTNAGVSWTVLGADVFGAALPEPAGQFPQYQAVGKVRVDPNNPNRVVAGTKTGLYLSYDAGVNWTGPCLTNAFNSQRQDITGLELTDISGTTRILAAVGTRGFATTVQYNLDQNGANGLYGGTIPASGCPTDFSLLSRNDNGFIYGAAVLGTPYAANNPLNAGTGTPYGGNINTGNQLGRMDITVAPSNPNYIYAQVGSIIANSASGCGNAAGCQLGVWSSIDGGGTWSYMAGSQGGALRQCGSTGTLGVTSGAAGGGDYPQNWYDQGMAVDPNNPDRVFIDTYDTWLATRTGTAFYNVTCGYNGSPVANHVVHVDHHALAFVPGSSGMLLEGSDGGIFSTANADLATENTFRPTWVNMDTGLNTIEFYSGDISGNFNTSATPSAAGGAQDNGPSTVLFAGSPTGPVQWQMGTGGDGFFARIDPVGTGTSLRYWLGNNSGGLSRCIGTITPCTSPGATWTSRRGAWTGDTQSFVLPFEIFHGDVNNPANDCGPAGATTGCGHLIAGTVRVWETLNGATATNTWYVNSPANLTKQTLGNRSFINQLAFEPASQNTVMVGTNDGNVQIGFGMGGGSNTSTWVNVTGGNVVLPNRPILDVAFDPTTTTAPIAYAAVGGFDQNTPTIPGHVFRVNCAASCASFTWEDKSGNLPNIPVDSIIVNPNVPNQVFAGTDIGLYYTNNISALSPVWYRYSAGLPNVMIWDMQIDRGATTLSLWTRGRGAFVWPLPTTPTAATASISGRITTADGLPLAGVSMTLSGARSAKVISDANGNYRFQNIDIDHFYTLTPRLMNFHFAPESEPFSLLGNKTDAMFTATRDSVSSGNAIDTADFFVRQHYLDFLGREPDESGFNFWSDQIASCGIDAGCRERKRINVSAAYFLSIEFQRTGGLVDGVYRASYGRRPLYGEFMPDVQQVAQGVVVAGGGDWEQRLALNKRAFLDSFVNRAAFRDAYDGLSNGSYVDALINQTGVSFNQSERDAFVAGLNSGTSTRAEVLGRIAENEGFVRAKRNEAFVMMQYFGYLRRDPDATGYAFWLSKMTEFNGNFEQAEMVKAFINSGEYRARFR